MKIHGNNQSRINPYQKQLQQNQNHHEQKKANQKDQIEISKQAKDMQTNDKGESQRSAHVQGIKQAVQSGDYRVDPHKTADKMLTFWQK